MHENRTNLEPLRLECVTVVYRADGTVWVEHLSGDTFGPFDSIVDAVEAGVA